MIRIILLALLATTLTAAQAEAQSTFGERRLAKKFLSLYEEKPPAHTLPGLPQCRPPDKMALTYWGPFENEYTKLPAFDLQGLSSADMTDDLMILQIFSSRCRDVILGQPLFFSAAQKIGLPVYGINLDDTPQELEQFLKDFGNPYKKIGINGKDAKILSSFGIFSYPHTLVLNRNHRVLWRYGNYMNEETINKDLLPFIENVRAEGAASSD